MIYIVGIVITLFLALILLTKSKKSPADRILFCWLCIILLHLILFSVASSEKYFDFPYFLGIEIPIPLLHGPFLFFYTKALTSGYFNYRNMFMHFIPFTIAIAILIPFFVSSQEEKIFVYQNEGLGYSISSSIILFGIIISGITYTLLSLQTIMKHKRMIRENFSYTERINLQWLYRLIIAFSCIWVLVIFTDDEVIFIAVVLFVIFIGYYGIKQVGIFTNTLQLSSLRESYSEITNDLKMASDKYERSSLTDTQIQKIHKSLIDLIEDKKIYLTPELTLAMVSDELEVHPNALSQVINSIEQKNFFDFINTLRIEEFKVRVADPKNQKYTLLSLAYDCGFNSKTAFNRNFKNLTGQSPSEYMKEVKTKFAR